jgi:hypothetical protein
VAAKDWEAAIVKQISMLEVGSLADQDQKSMAKNEQLVPADALLPEGAPPPAPPTGSVPGAPGMPGGPMGGTQAAAGEVYYLKTDPSAQFKILPIKITVLVDQARLADFLIGLENSPMSIQVLEIEINKPLVPVTKPTYGDKAYMGQMGSGSGAYESGGAGRPLPGGGSRAMGDPREGGMGGMPLGGRPGAGGGGAGTNNRGVDKRQQRKNQDSDSDKKDDGKVKIDQYYNVIELTVYGQARFYLAPPPAPTPPPSAAPDSNHPAPAPAPTPAPAPAQPAETPKAEAPKAETPATEAPKPETPKADAPNPDAPKSEPTKSEPTKSEPTKSEAPKPDAPKPDAPSPGR